MCCFAFRVFVLLFCTIFSFILHRLYPDIAVVFYYLMLVNLFSLCIISLFLKERLPEFVKPAAMHYFSAIGGFLGSILALALAGKLGKNGFSAITLIISGLWFFLISLVLANFEYLLKYFGAIFV